MARQVQAIKKVYLADPSKSINAEITVKHGLSWNEIVEIRVMDDVQTSYGMWDGSYTKKLITLYNPGDSITFYCNKNGNWTVQSRHYAPHHVQMKIDGSTIHTVPYVVRGIVIGDTQNLWTWDVILDDLSGSMTDRDDITWSVQWNGDDTKFTWVANGNFMRMKYNATITQDQMAIITATWPTLDNVASPTTQLTGTLVLDYGNANLTFGYSGGYYGYYSSLISPYYHGVL